MKDRQRSVLHSNLRLCKQNERKAWMSEAAFKRNSLASDKLVRVEKSG